MKGVFDFSWYPRPAREAAPEPSRPVFASLTVEEIRALIREEIERDRAIRSALPARFRLQEYIHARRGL